MDTRPIQRDPLTPGQAFPEQGRLPQQPRDIAANLAMQQAEHMAEQSRINIAAGRVQPRPCCMPLHISLFFDGTNNNEPDDKKLTKAGLPGPLSNVARLFHASIGSKDDIGSRNGNDQGFYSYYMPGVGTPFPKIGELEYSNEGLRYATGGEGRIHWALTRLLAAVHSACDSTYPDSSAKTLVANLATTWPVDGKTTRTRLLTPELETLAALVRSKNQTKPKLLAIKLYVYGFSRGAAEARAFVNWLLPLLARERDGEAGYFLAGLPLSIEFLGLFDTVASVGVAHIAPFFDGHMSWADDSMRLPDSEAPGYIKCCRHFVSAHEQRLCFPLDSLRAPSADGCTSRYPSYAQEVLYPGVHSDVGGGYEINEQGMGREQTGMLLSQIALHDMYAAALQMGAPLQVPAEALTAQQLQDQPWRVMSGETLPQFQVAPALVKRYNAWRASCGNGALEDVVAVQLAQLTAWRIRRLAKPPYPREDYRQQPFYTVACSAERNEDADPATRKRNEKARDDKQATIEQQRQADIDRANQERAETGKTSEQAPAQGERLYEPSMDGQQWDEAAAEFRADYEQRLLRPQESVWQLLLDTIPAASILLLNSDDELVEYQRLKSEGEAAINTLFGPQQAEVLALFDNHVHDSRAWFMYSTLGSREPWSGYFRYRMIYLGSQTNKSLSPVAIAGRIVGIATLAVGVIYTVRQRKLQNILGGLAGTLGALSLEYQIVDLASGITLPLLPEAAELLRFSNDIGDVVAQQTQAARQDAFEQQTADVMQWLAANGGRICGQDAAEAQTLLEAITE